MTKNNAYSEPLPAKYVGAMHFTLLGETDIAALYKPWAQGIIQAMLIHRDQSRAIIKRENALDSPQLYESAGYAKEEFKLYNETYRADIYVECEVNERQCSITIEALTRPPEQEEEKEEKEEEDELTEELGYLWVGIRPIGGGEEICQMPIWWILPYNPDGDNWQTDIGTDDIAGYFHGSMVGMDMGAFMPWVFEPYTAGHNDTYAIQMGGESMVYPPLCLLPTDQMITTGATGQLMSFVTDQNDTVYVTKNGTFMTWGFNNKHQDPEKEEASGEWFSTFWVDPSGEDTRGAPEEILGKLERRYLKGFYEAIGISNEYPGIPGAHTPMDIEFEVRWGKKPAQKKKTFMLTIEQPTSAYRTQYPNGYRLPYSLSGCRNLMLGSNPFMENCAGTVQCSPFKKPRLKGGANRAASPAWGFTLGDGADDVQKFERYDTTSTTVHVCATEGWSSDGCSTEAYKTTPSAYCMNDQNDYPSRAFINVNARRTMAWNMTEAIKTDLCNRAPFYPSEHIDLLPHPRIDRGVNDVVATFPGCTEYKNVTGMLEMWLRQYKEPAIYGPLPPGGVAQGQYPFFDWAASLVEMYGDECGMGPGYVHIYPYVGYDWMTKWVEGGDSCPFGQYIWPTSRGVMYRYEGGGNWTYVE